jgi:hypothetical protein
VERDPGTHWIGNWVDPIAGLNDVEKLQFLTLPELKLRSFGRPAYRYLIPIYKFSRNIFVQMNIYRVTLEIHVKMHVDRHAKFQPLLADLNTHSNDYKF